MAKVTIEVELPEGQKIPTAYDIQRLTDPNWMSIWWHTEDVQNHARDCNIKISEGEARVILDLAQDNHDCNVGINWDVLSYWIDQVRKH